MELRRYNPYDRYRRRNAGRLLGFFVVCAMAGLFFAAGYYFGHVRTGQEDAMLRQQFKAVEAERDQLQQTVTSLRADAQTAMLRLQQVEKTYQDVAPGGPGGEIMELVNKQLSDGMDPQRLLFLIRSARPPRNCVDPETRRFIVSTPAYTGAESSASIAEGNIIVKGSGASARNDKGEKEAWYDPAKPVTVEFVLKDGKTEKKVGIMPLSHSVVMEGREYRFTVTEGARSFAKVTYDSCDYP